MKKKLKKTINSLILMLPFIGKWRKVFLLHSNPGHYYSPISDLDEILSRENKIFDFKKEIKSINLNDKKQIEILNNYKDKSFVFNDFLKNKFNTYNEDNIYFSYHDAVSLFIIINEFKPHKIIEIGSGFSSCLMIDINEHLCQNNISLTFVEPFPMERLIPLTKSLNKVHFKLIENFIQNININHFEELNENDILFVDSSHVSKVGSDLNYILFEILPRLKKGVIIHFHDVHFPFEYPKEWIYMGYSWNETYLLRAFLMYNNDFEIIFMNSMMAINYSNIYADSINPLYDYSLPKSGGVYIKKIN